MPEQRIIFAKEGKSKYISHLDLLHTLQRVFARAKVPVRHSEGFNPHPKMSIALPLSVGQESVCELLDFSLLQDMPLSELPDRLNRAMPEGIRVIDAYNALRKIRELKWLSVTGTMEYDTKVPESIVSELEKFFSDENIIIQKRSKSGISDFNISQCIREIRFEVLQSNIVMMRAVVTAQNPALNPENLAAALRQLMPSIAPDFVSFRREEIYDFTGKVFR